MIHGDDVEELIDRIELPAVGSIYVLSEKGTRKKIEPKPIGFLRGPNGWLNSQTTDEEE